MKKFGRIRRIIIAIIGLAFLLGALAMLWPLVSGRPLPQDDVYAILFLAVSFGAIALTLFWVVWDMGRKMRQALSAEDITAAVLPQMFNISDGGDFDAGD